MSYKNIVKEVVGSQTTQPYRIMAWHQVPQAQGQVFYTVEAMGNHRTWGEEGGEYDTFEDALRAIEYIERNKGIDLLERRSGQ